MGNFFQDWTPSGDDEEQRKLRAWQALAGDQAPHRSMANQVQLPEMDVVADPHADEVDMTPPPTAARAPSDSQPVDMSDPPPPPSATARLGSMLSGRDEAPAPSESVPRDEPRSMGNDASPWAVLADVLLNKGRGVGGILAQGAAGKSEERRAELDLKRAQAEHLRNPTVDPATAAYKQAMLDLQKEREQRLIAQGGTRADLTRTNIENTQKRFDTHRMDVTDPNSQFNQTQVLQSGQRAGASAQGRIGAEHDLNDVVTGDKAQIAGAESAARIGATHDLAPITTADEAAKARAVGYAGNEPKLAYEQSMNPVLADRSTYGVGSGLTAENFSKDNPGLHINDPDQLDRAMKTRAINAKTLEQIQSARGAGSIIQRLHDTADEIQRTNPFSDRAATLRRQYKVHTAEYASIMMGMTNKSEGSREEYESQVPDPNINPKALAGVEGLWGGLEQNIDRNLGALGIGADKPKFLMDREASAKGAARQQPTDADGGPAAPSINATNPTPSASPAKGDYANYSRDTSDPPNLGKAPVPKIPTAAQRGTNISPRQVTKPDGTTKTENLSDEETATLNARRGWSVK